MLLRLPCSLLIEPRVLLGGVLYVGPAGMRFQPHVTLSPSLREPVRIEPPERITLRRMEVALTLRDPVLGRRVELLLVECDGWLGLFGVPEPAETQRRIERALREFARG